MNGADDGNITVKDRETFIAKAKEFINGDKHKMATYYDGKMYKKNISNTNGSIRKTGQCDIMFYGNM